METIQENYNPPQEDVFPDPVSQGRREENDPLHQPRREQGGRGFRRWGKVRRAERHATGRESVQGAGGGVGGGGRGRKRQGAVQLRHEGLAHANATVSCRGFRGTF